MKSRELLCYRDKKYLFSFLFCGFIGSKKPKKTEGKEKECFKHWNRKFFCAVRSFNVWQQKAEKGNFLAFYCE